MADRRMFSKKIIDSDAFLDMPLSTQALYFHLSMRADDDGFVNNPKKIQRMIGASDDDLRVLVAKSFLIPFESGIVVIKHWRIHNYIQRDRYTPTAYTDEMRMLATKENGAYTVSCIQTVSNMDTDCIQPVSKLDTQVSIGKLRDNKVIESIGECEGETRTRFKPPTVEEVAAYCKERGNHINPEHFCDYYQRAGWRLKTGPMRDWKAAVRTWEQRDKTRASERRSDPRSAQGYQQREYTENMIDLYGDDDKG